MYMCSECFNLFNDTTNNNRCPLSSCHSENSLVWIDNNIADYISELNLHFKLNNIPFRTLFCCGSHLNEDQSSPNLVLANTFCPDTLSDEDAKIMCEHFIHNIEPLVEELNQSILKNCFIKKNTPFKVYYSKNKHNSNNFYYDTHRVIINGLSYEHLIKMENGRTENDIHRYRQIIHLEIETAFRRFLINLIHLVKNNGV